MDTDLQVKAERCATLLAHSPLDPEIKEAIVSNLSAFTMGDLDRLLVSLEAEERAVGVLGDTLDDVAHKQDAEWSALEDAQKQKSTAMVNDMFRSLEAEIQDKIRAQMK